MESIKEPMKAAMEPTKSMLGAVANVQAAIEHSCDWHVQTLMIDIVASLEADKIVKLK
jgi:hypothetical protein